MFKNIIHSIFTKGIVALINFFILIITSRYFGISARGEISIFILNITIIQLINETYTGYSLVYFIPKFNLKKIFIIGIIYTLIFTSLSNLIIVFINKQIIGFEWMGYIISLIIIINSFNSVLILGKEKVKLYNFLNFLQPFLLLLGVLIYIFILNDNSINSFVFPLFFSFAISFVISFVYAQKLVFFDLSFTNYEFKPIIINGIICQASTLMFILGNRYSYYLLPSTSKIGLYSTASSLIESILIISNGISPILLARVANLGDTKQSSKITLSLSKISLIISSIAVIIIFIIPETLYLKILGNEFIGIKRLMMLYAPGILMISFFGIISNYFSAIGQLKTVLLSNSLGFFFTLILAPLLIKKYDLAGAAYTANITYLIIALSIFILFFKINKLPINNLFSFKSDFINLKKLLFNK